MYYFKATQDKNKIIISSNTYWNCKVEGNCLLSKSNGIGNDVIEIKIPRELAYTSGKLKFSYGDERCQYPELEVFYVNDCYIETIPSYSVCGNGNILAIPFNHKNEMLTVTILSNGIWTTKNVINCNLVKNRDELVIIPVENKDGALEIVPNLGCKENIVTIQLKYLGE
jgi:hypothetical protein